MKPKDEEKLKAIAQATLDLVEQAGLSGLTMPAIARRAGVATGTLYVYYASKDELLTALYEQAKTALTARVLQGVDPAAPFRTRFQQMWRSLLDNRLQHAAEMVFMEQYSNSPWFSESSRALSARLMTDFTAPIEAAKAQQILKDLPTPMLVNAMAGSVRDTAALLRSGAIEASEAHLAMAFGVFWDGVKA
ncbi:TetR/AcrR family transcriptional regulator [Leptothrix discophora]|uniref:TetR/AcrR family transcriptional regulator n=1 Tax=Leptothrix discophora TaxID=89 RepID=A0ABT9G357_LEPDI|nr:TetR/AcrR family transcriptional regulator [Leptothrix discophora]MDP4300851.1 TetR/AcrR family transcriptional regulator [Leptothrix discophora]